MIRTTGLTLLLCSVAVAQQEPVHHDLEVVLHPLSHGIEVSDTLTLPADLRGEQPVRFQLHAGLEVRVDDSAYRLEMRPGGSPEKPSSGEWDTEDTAVPLREYTLSPAGGSWPEDARPVLRYAGRIHHPLVQEEEEAARSFSRSPGLITAEGAVLSGASYWIPQIGARLLTFSLTASFAGLPEEEGAGTWDVVSQGERTRHQIAGGAAEVTWACPHPMDEVYLIAAPFAEYSRPAGAATAYAFLRAPDSSMAAKYLEATAQYLDMYQRLIGPYPYRKFALIENFWETGYGMPSFTLLGPAVIRLPFILHSSYPHEILHNWWGNSVFVDYGSGNWCEGLTAYLADHLIKEGQGKGEEYRRDSLKKYLNYVQSSRDFPLTEFRSRHSPATEAVGYGKSLMLFHMLRRELGDELFARGLARFYRQFKFRRASFLDLEQVFSATAERDLAGFFEQWIQRTGAPVLELAEVEVRGAGAGFSVRAVVSQTQEGAPYALSVPVAFSIEGQSEAVVHTLALDARSGELLVELPARPTSVAVDPQFDVFRRLDRKEIPSSLGQLFGAEAVTVVLPRDGAGISRAAWREVGAAWFQGSEEKVEFVAEEDLEEMPAGRAVWIFGSDNRFGAALRDALDGFGAGAAADTVSFGPEKVSRDDHSFVFTIAREDDPDLALGWVGSAVPAALPGLARKLPHYGKYSYLAFAGTEPSNVVKGQWSAVGSPLVEVLPGGADAPAAALPGREALASLESVFDPARLLGHVRTLSAAEWEGRGVGTEGLERSAQYIAQRFEEAGLKPGGEGGSWFQTWTEADGPGGRAVELKNVIGILPGRNADWSSQSAVLGAHYDHLGRGWPDARTGQEGKVHPGADDNASGVSVLLEVAALLGPSHEPGRTLVFVAFSGEEWGLKGSRHYVKAMRQWPAAETLAMVNLDTVGRLDGKKLTVLGTGSATEWMHIAMGIGFTTGVESTCVADDLGSSDQRAFLDAGIPAVQLFSGPTADYHRPSDTADKVDSQGLVQVATFVREAVVYLGDREQPLTSTLTAAEAPPAAAAGSRRVSLGTMPDFAYEGKGVKVASVLKDSPAAKAGLKGGDVILAIDGAEVSDLRGYSEILKSHAPGDRIEIRVLREGEEMTFVATLVAR